MPDLFWTDCSGLEADAIMIPLSDYRREKLARIRDPRLRCSSAAAELLLIRALSERPDAPPLPLKICCDAMGKPFLPDSRYFFNLSHSGDYAACCLAEYPVGVDVQVIRPCRKELVERFFSSAEQEHIARCEDKDRAFTRIWARKESFLKAIGLGLRLPLASLETAPETDRIHYGTDAFVFREEALPDGQLCLCVPAAYAEEKLNLARVELPG